MAEDLILTYDIYNILGTQQPSLSYACHGKIAFTSLGNFDFIKPPQKQ
jgi:hypothetical protein